MTDNVLDVTLEESGGTKDYRYLANKPKINSVELIGDKTAEDLRLQGSMEAIAEHDIDILMYGG